MNFSVIIFLFIYSKYADSHLISAKKWRETANSINAANSTWKAAVTPHSAWSKHGYVNVKIHFGGGALETAQTSELLSDQDQTADHCENNMPKEFDGRKRWPWCESVIGHVYNQGQCGSCWAVAIASTFSDRVCIASFGENKSLYSSQQLVSCCHKCWRVKNGTGCDGGWPLKAWSYIKNNGLSTGGEYLSNEGCQPYLFSPWGIPKRIPKCKLHCYNESYGKSFKEDRIKVEKYYEVSRCGAMNEIYHYGSIVSYFPVYEDFLYYSSGVYQYQTGEKLDFHVVRVIGWGEENGVPYWLAVNSWGKYWGDQGLFKIKRGSNELWFEENLTAGRIAKLH